MFACIQYNNTKLSESMNQRCPNFGELLSLCCALLRIKSDIEVSAFKCSSWMEGGGCGMRVGRVERLFFKILFVFKGEDQFHDARLLKHALVP